MKNAARALYAARIWSLGAGLLASSAALLILMLSNLIGSLDFRDASRSDDRRVGVWLAPAVSASTRDKRAAAWRLVWPADRPRFETESLTALLNAAPSVVLVPDSRALGDEAIDRLLRFVLAGGGLIVTGSVAVVDREGGWLGYERMRALLGVERVTSLSPDLSSGIRGALRGPLSTQLLPDEVINLVPEPGVAAVATSDPELVWHDDGVQSGTPGLAAASRRRVGSGRIVWLGAGPESAADNTEASGPMARLIAGSIAWAAGDPWVEVLDLDPARTSEPPATSERVAATARRVGSSRLLVSVTNRRGEATGVAIRLHLEHPFEGVRVSATKLFQALPRIQADPVREIAMVELDELAGHTSESWNVDY